MKVKLVFGLFLVLTVSGFLSAESGVNLIVSISGTIYPIFSLDSSAQIPDSVLAEAKNPSITNPYTGHAFGVKTIGSYDPRNNVLKGGAVLSADLMLSGKNRRTVYGKVKFPFSYFDNIGGSGYNYAYSKTLGSGADWVVYLYGAKAKFQPSIEVGWEKKNIKEFDGEIIDQNKLRLGLELQNCKIKFYKALEAYARPQDFVLLGESTERFLIFHANYQIERINFGLSVPIKGAKGAGISFAYLTHD